MKRIIRNISFNFLVRLITYLFSFLTVLYVTRVLQPEAYGKASFAGSFAGYFVMLANLGMPIYAMRLCAEKKDDRAALSCTVNELWSIGFLLSVFSMAALLVTIRVVPVLQEDRLLLIIYGSGILFHAFGFEWLFKGLERFRFLAVSLLVCKIFSLLCMVLFIHSAEQLPLYAFFSVLTAYGSNVVCLLAVRQHVDLSFRLHLNREHFKPLFVFFLMSCAVNIYSSLDLTMLGFMKSDLETGLYSVAAKGKSVLTLLGGVVWTSMLPQVTELWKEGKRERFEALAGKTMVAVFCIQFCVTVLCMLFVKEIVVVVGGEAYAGAANAFRILLLSLVPIGVSNILGGQVLIPAGQESCLLCAEIAGAVINFIANLFMIPLYSIEGAAVTTVVSELVVCVICLYFVRRKLQMDFGVGLVRKTGRKLGRVAKRFFARLMSRIRKDKLPFYCPCCETYLKEFVDGGFTRRPERYLAKRYAFMDQKVICPICGSLPRHRILVSWMQEHIGLFRAGKILHFAQERSLRLWMDRNQVSYTTADLYQAADLKLDIEDTGLADNSCDVIICNHVLEHVSDYRKALRELHRIIRPAGRIILSFPVDPALEGVYEDAEVVTKEGRREHFGQNDHLRVFGRDSVSMLESFGFHVEEIRGDACDERIKPVIGPADYDYNVLWCLTIEGR